MKTTIFGLVCGIALAAGPLSATAALPQSATVKTSDHTLTERIETRVRQDAALKKPDVKVTVDAGVATLTGTVASAAEKTRAAQLARVTGITRVDNRLVVDRSIADAVAQGTKGTVAETKEVAKAAGETAKEAGGKIKEGAVKVGGKTKEGAATAVEKTKEGAATIGITAGASAPDELVEHVIAAIARLRPIEVSKLDGIVENVRFSLPLELRRAAGKASPEAIR